MTSFVATRPATTRLPAAIVGMALFLMAETMLFAGLISTSLVLRATSRQGWNADSLIKLPLWLSAANMAILLISGWMLRCGRVRTAIALGAVFFAVQGVEWSRMLTAGIHQAASVYAGVFYGLIGTHALHVVGGLACLIFCTARASNLTRRRVAAMYWYFVVLVWPAIYGLVYL